MRSTHPQERTYGIIPICKVYEADLIVGNRLIIELKHCDKLAPIHVAQLINYLCTTGIEHGLLINFGSPKFEIVKRIFSKKPPQDEALP